MQCHRSGAARQMILMLGAWLGFGVGFCGPVGSGGAPVGQGGGTGGSQIIVFEKPGREPDGGGMGDVIKHLPPGVTGATNGEPLKIVSTKPPSPDETLFLAAGGSDAAEVRGLLDAGANVNARQALTGMTPLMACSTRAIAAILLERGADARARDLLGATALHHAVFAPEAVSLAPLLVSHGADVNAIAEKQNAESPLLAARRLFFEGRDPKRAEAVIRMLVAAGADVNAADDAGYTALATAAVNRKPDMTRLLLSLGADTARRTKDGQTPLAIARELGFMEIAELLIADGAKE